MKKSVYSLVLSDAVIAAVDRMAYARGLSRSQLVNEVLASYVSYVTPEQRIRSAFARIEELLGQGSIQPLSAPSETMLSLRSALVYKYNPTVRYQVELFRTAGEEIGELRVSLRTQNAALLHDMECFFRIWQEVEAAHGVHAPSAIAAGKYVRRLRYAGGGTADAQTLGEAVAQYIYLLDDALKAYFATASDAAHACAAVEQVYLSRNTGKIV